MNIRSILRGLGSSALLLLCSPTVQAAEDSVIEYPKTRTVEVVDVYHGTEVADPYRWLEDQYADEVGDWVKSQNEVTFAYLEQLPMREEFAARLTELWDFAKMGTPWRVQDRYFFRRNDGLQNQSVLYVQEGLEGDARVLLDPNTLSADGTVALGQVVVSDDASKMAYSLNESGSDWQTWHVRDIDSGEDLPDVLKDSKFSGASWLPDTSGFFYCAYAAPDEETKLMDANASMKLFFHRLGDPQSADRLVYERPDQPRWGFAPAVTDDGRYLVIGVWENSAADRVFYMDLGQGDSEVVELLVENDAHYDFVDNIDDTFYFRTDAEASRGRLVAIDLKRPERENWVTVIAEGEDTLQSVDLVDDQFAAIYMHDAYEQIRLFDLGGAPVGDVDLPMMGNVTGFGGKRSDTETFFSFTSYLSPSEVWRYDFRTGESEKFWAPQIDFDFDAYTVEQVFYESKDGTAVPMFLVHRKDLVRDGSNPTLLYGYGGFGVSMVPGFRLTTLPWLERGGVYAVACLRGGGEYGDDWHKAGMQLNKQNVFDDFIAAGEWLVANRVTRPDRMACQGGSNGGTLVGAVLNQRPDLFGAAVPAVGVMDMLRFQKFTIGWAWVSDYGSSDDPGQFEALYAYSPYHNLVEQEYPAVLVTTADHDDRVVPGHSFKYAARLQAVQQGSDPVLIRIDTKAGHGAGKPTAKQIEEAADVLSFLAFNLEMDVEPGL